MWMDAHVHQILIRQQLAEADRYAARQHMIDTALARPPRHRWAALRQRIRSAVRPWRRHLVERTATR